MATWMHPKPGNSLTATTPEDEAGAFNAWTGCSPQGWLNPSPGTELASRTDMKRAAEENALKQSRAASGALPKTRQVRQRRNVPTLKRPEGSEIATTNRPAAPMMKRPAAFEGDVAAAPPMMKRPAASEGDSEGEAATRPAAAAPGATAKKPAMKRRILKPPTAAAPAVILPSSHSDGPEPTNSADKQRKKTFAGVIEPKGRAAKAAWNACKDTWEH